MKATIRQGLPLDQMLAGLPPEYQRLVGPADFPETSYTLVQFPPSRDGVVLSRPVAKALKKLDPGRQVVALGPNFTEEALQVLREHGARVFCIGEFHWTDASYTSVRQL